VNVFAGVWQWLTAPAQWTGSGGIPTRVGEHLGYSALAVLVAAVIAIPLGAVTGHTGRGGFLVAGLANWLRALPELGLLVILVVAMGINLLPVEIGLVVLAVPPLLVGTYAGVRNVDPAVVDAARGMGMRGGRLLWQVELPTALPLIFGGLRAASLQVIATATIAAYVSLGGLGRFIFDGESSHDFPQMFGGAVVIAVLAVLVELLLAGVQRLVVSPGLRTGRTRRLLRRTVARTPATDLA
jgi:osmoprotectant transport system permease protein